MIGRYQVLKKDIEAGKELVNDLTQNKLDQHSEIILDFGVHIAQNSAQLLNDVSFANYVEEFFLAAMDLKQMLWAQIFLRAICI